MQIFCQQSIGPNAWRGFMRIRGTWQREFERHWILPFWWREWCVWKWTMSRNYLVGRNGTCFISLVVFVDSHMPAVLKDPKGQFNFLTRERYCSECHGLRWYAQLLTHFPVAGPKYIKFFIIIRSCLVSKKISIVSVTSNVRTHAWSIKCSWKKTNYTV